LDEDDFVDWLQTGCFRLNVETQTLHHQPSGLEIDISSVIEHNTPNWTIDQNYSTKNAKLKHLDTGAVWPILNLFRERGHILKGKVKPTYIRQTPLTPSTPAPALIGGRTPERSIQRHVTSGGRTSDGRPQAGQQHGNGPSAERLCTAGHQSSENMQLAQGRDGRYRLAAVSAMSVQTKSSRDTAAPGATPKSSARAAKQSQYHEANHWQGRCETHREQSPSLSPRCLSADFEEEEDENRMTELRKPERLQTQALKQDFTLSNETSEWDSKSEQSEKTGYYEPEALQEVPPEFSDDEGGYAAESSEGEYNPLRRHGSHVPNETIKETHKQQGQLKKAKVKSSSRVNGHIPQPWSPSQKRRRILQRCSSGS
jgi:hypothetical protein